MNIWTSVCTILLDLGALAILLYFISQCRIKWKTKGVIYTTISGIFTACLVGAVIYFSILQFKDPTKLVSLTWLMWVLIGLPILGQLVLEIVYNAINDAKFLEEDEKDK